jgi:hypothetical protein
MLGGAPNMLSIRGAKLVLIGVVALVLNTNARATVLYSDLGQNDPIGGSALGFGPSDFSGISFSPMIGGTVDNIELALSVQSQSTENFGTQVYLTNVGLDGNPSQVLETFVTGALPPADSPSLVTVNSVAHPLLTPSNEYFLVLGGGPGIGWFYSNTVGVTGEFIWFTAPPGHWQHAEDTTSMAFRVNRAGADVPDPSSTSLFVIGLAGMIALRLFSTSSRGHDVQAP